MIRKSFFLTILLAILLSSIDTWAAEPTIQAKYISFRSITTTTASIKWVNGNGSKRVVALEATTNSVFTNPIADTEDYTAATSNYTTTPATKITTRIVYEGTGNSVAVTGLIAGTTYLVKVYEYNTVLDYYLADGISHNPRSFTTVAASIVAPTTVAVAGITTSTLDFTWVNGGNASGYYVKLAKDAAFLAIFEPFITVIFFYI